MRLVGALDLARDRREVPVRLDGHHSLCAKRRCNDREQAGAGADLEHGLYGRKDVEPTGFVAGFVKGNSDNHFSLTGYVGTCSDAIKCTLVTLNLM